MGVTRKSSPEAFSLAQSKGECPGASTTFCLGLFAGGNVDTESPRFADVVLLRRGRVIVGGGISNEAVVGIILGGLMAGALGVVGSEESSFSGDGGGSGEGASSLVVEGVDGGVMDVVDGGESRTEDGVRRGG
jgi:hypothetical protein